MRSHIHQITTNLLTRSQTGGDHFTELREQQALLEVLKYTDIEHAWPTTQIQERLKHSWGWV